MRVIYTAAFRRHYKARIRGNSSAEKSFLDVLRLISADKADELHLHLLRGTMRGKTSIALDYDLRVICRVYEWGFIFLDIGTHKEVYTPSSSSS